MNGGPTAVLGIPSHQRRRFVKEAKRHRLNFVTEIQLDRRIGRRLPTGRLADLADQIMHLLIDVGPDQFDEHRYRLGELPSPLWDHIDRYAGAMVRCVEDLGGAFSASLPSDSTPMNRGWRDGTEDLALAIAAEAVMRARLKTVLGAERSTLERAIDQVVGEHAAAIGSEGSTSGEYISRVWGIMREKGVVIEAPEPLRPDLVDLRAWP